MQLTFDNSGKQPHHMVALPINEGKTIKDVATFLKKEKGEPPFSEEGGFDTAIVDGGTEQAFGAEAEAGQVRARLLHRRPRGRAAARGQGDDLRGEWSSQG